MIVSSSVRSSSATASVGGPAAHAGPARVASSGFAARPRVQASLAVFALAGETLVGERGRIGQHPSTAPLGFGDTQAAGTVASIRWIT